MLKSLLSLLLSKFYSKKESALVASLALPDKSVSTSVSVTGGRDEYVAPSDGYLEFVTTVTNNGINVYGQVLQTSSYPREGRAAKLFVPIAKGKKTIFEVAADTSVTFYALVWGGVQALKNALLQGGGLCLSHWYSSLRRNSCRINVRLSRRGITRRIPEPNYSLSQERTMSSFLQQTASFKLFCAKILKGLDLALSHKGAVTAENAQELTHRIYQDGTRYSSLFKKGLRSSFLRLSLVPHQNVYFCLTKTNSAVGGASC